MKVKFFKFLSVFSRKKEYTLNRVRDQITVKEGNETLQLYVDFDPNTIVHRIQKAQKTLLNIKPDSEREERIQAAKALAVAIFGEEQTQQLFDFYHDDENCVVTICGMYFSDQKHGLGKKITQAQKKNKNAII